MVRLRLRVDFGDGTSAVTTTPDGHAIHAAYASRSWSYGGATAHDVTTPGVDTTYAATFSC